MSPGNRAIENIVAAYNKQRSKVVEPAVERPINYRKNFNHLPIFQSNSVSWWKRIIHFIFRA